MPAPLAKGLIIAASVLVAAGIAIYESPQVRQWVDQSRRKIAVALHSLGDDIQPRRNSESSDDFEARKKEIARIRRNELIRRAREEGVAVDLDELARIGREEVELTERKEGKKRTASGRSFDDFVGTDGMLKKTAEAPTATTTGADNTDENTALRNRASVVASAGVASFAAGATLASRGNPFSDDNILFDHDEEAPSPKPFTYTENAPETRESSATVQADFPSPSAQLIDLTPESVYLHPEQAQAATNPWASTSLHESVTTNSTAANAEETEQAAQSFYSFASEDDQDHEPETLSTGTLTPRSSTSSSAFTGASIVGSQADDVAILESMQHNESDHDAQSEIFSESGFTQAGFSEVGDEDRGIMTPNSWTDVGSDDESEWGGVGAGGQVSQYQQVVQQ